MRAERLVISIKDGEVLTLQGLDTVSAERLEDILNYVAESKESLDSHKLINKAVGVKRAVKNIRKFIKCFRFAIKED